MTEPTSSARDSSRWDRKAPGNVSPSHLAAPPAQCSVLRGVPPWAHGFNRADPSRVPTTIMVAVISAICLDLPPSSAKTSPRQTISVRPACTTCPTARRRSPLAGDMKLTLNSVVSTAASAGIMVRAAKPQAVSTMVVTAPA